MGPKRRDGCAPTIVFGKVPMPPPKKDHPRHTQGAPPPVSEGANRPVGSLWRIREDNGPFRTESLPYPFLISSHGFLLCGIPTEQFATVVEERRPAAATPVDERFHSLVGARVLRAGQALA